MSSDSRRRYLLILSSKTHCMSGTPSMRFFMVSLFPDPIVISLKRKANWMLAGIEITLYFNTMKLLWRRKEKDPKATRFYMIYSTASFFLITIFLVVEAMFGQEMWIINANFPGGSAAYLATYAAVWYQTMGTTASVILQLMSDGVLIYRCFVVWNNMYLLIFPCILWVATLILGIFELYTSGSPSGNAKSMAKYTGTIPIIIESGLPYAISGIAFVVSLGIGSQISILFLSLYVMFTCISPQMIIMRVADGKAWERQQLNDTSVMVLNTFKDNGTSIEESSMGMGVEEAA
ncbi:hypothetical protein BU15DRAFT_73969 [Melanogaster broomeanus]|nr:hypothetical protein BU15DRAFT_73969 [Melanogaster broomeanus]